MAASEPREYGLAELAALVRDGDAVVSGGLPLWRKPLALVRAIAEAGRRDLRYSAFLASLDAEILVEAGCIAELEFGYVGRDLLGASRVLARREDLIRRPQTEIAYWAAVCAATAGEATRPDALGAPVAARRFDACLLHSSLITADGDVYAFPLDLMEEDDVLLAKASDRVLVTVEERRPAAPPGAVPLIARREITGYAVVPAGAAPLGMAGYYNPSIDALLGPQR